MWGQWSEAVREAGLSKNAATPDFTGVCKGLPGADNSTATMRDVVLEPTTLYQDSIGKQVTSKGVYPKSVPYNESKPVRECLNLPADLAEVTKAWPTLPAAIRAGILAMVKATTGG